MPFKRYKRGQAVGIKTDDPDRPQWARVIHDSDENTDAISVRFFRPDEFGVTVGENRAMGKAGLVDLPQDLIDKIEAEPF